MSFKKEPPIILTYRLLCLRLLKENYGLYHLKTGKYSTISFQFVSSLWSSALHQPQNFKYPIVTVIIYDKEA